MAADRGLLRVAGPPRRQLATARGSAGLAHRLGPRRHGMDERRHRVVHRGMRGGARRWAADRRRRAIPPAPLSAVMPFAASQARAARLRPPVAASGEKAGAMPPVSTPSSASAGPGSAIAVSAAWRSPSAAAAACRAARAASARPGSGVSTGGAGQSSDAARRCRTGAPARRTPPPPGRAGWRRAPGDRQRRIRAVLDAEQRQQAGEIGHADREPRRRREQPGSAP